jgi:hypothetical protein
MAEIGFVGLGVMGSRITRRLLLMAVIRQRVNVTSASIPGPPVPLYLAGARLLEVFPVLPLIANEPLGVGALSYAGTFTIGVVAGATAQAQRTSGRRRASRRRRSRRSHAGSRVLTPAAPPDSRPR